MPFGKLEWQLPEQANVTKYLRGNNFYNLSHDCFYFFDMTLTLYVPNDSNCTFFVLLFDAKKVHKGITVF